MTSARSTPIKPILVDIWDTTVKMADRDRDQDTVPTQELGCLIGDDDGSMKKARARLKTLECPFLVDTEWNLENLPLRKQRLGEKKNLLLRKQRLRKKKARNRLKTLEIVCNHLKPFENT